MVKIHSPLLCACLFWTVYTPFVRCGEKHIDPYEKCPEDDIIPCPGQLFLFSLTTTACHSRLKPNVNLTFNVGPKWNALPINGVGHL